MTGVRITHIGGPTVLIEVGGWRLLTDPTFDPQGNAYRLGWAIEREFAQAPADIQRRVRWLPIGSDVDLA